VTRLQQVLFQLETDYLGHPYYVSGHALYNAIARQVDATTRRSLHASHGVFVPKEYGRYPECHSQDGYAGKLGGSLPPVESYEDLFLYRDPAHRWLMDSRPRALHNTHDVQTHGGRVAFAPRAHVGRRPEVRDRKRTIRWFLQCYLHADGDGDDGVLPVADDVLDGLRLGGARNYGLGEVSLADTRLVELDELDYSRLRAADEYVLELVSPYVTASEYPGADGQSIPWWWDPTPGSDAAATIGTHTPDGESLRRRREQLVVDGETYEVQTVDHGQVVGYAGDRPIETAKNGVLRVGTHSRHGFGELRVRPAGEDRVPERAVSADETATGQLGQGVE
jgi:hypothetical protein